MTGPIYVDVSLDNLGGDNTNDGVRPPEVDGGLAVSEGQGAIKPAEMFQGQGPLLENPDEVAVFQQVHQTVKRQEPLAKNREASGKHYGRVRRGVPFSELKKDEDRNVWKAELPPGVSDTTAPVPNKTDDLCAKITSQITVDPFLPEPKPETDSDKARYSADLSKKWLTADGDESGTNDSDLLRDAVDRSHTRSSAFAFFWVDETGNGWRPLQILAHPQAQDPNNPMVATDPMGMPLPTSDPVLRYVTEQGQFTENASEAARQWLPKIRRSVLNPANVRTVPITADVSQAKDVVLVMCEAYGVAKRMLPGLADFDQATLKEIANWRPLRPKACVPLALQGQYKRSMEPDAADDAVTDDTLIFWYHQFCTSGQDYPDGAEVAVSGALDGIVLKRDTLRNDLTLDDNTVKPVLRDIPVSQCRSLLDSEYGDPFGRPIVERVSGTNESLAQLYGSVLEDIDRKLHPNVFIDSMSTVQDWQLVQRNGTPIPIIGGKDAMPMYEEFGDLPAFLPMIVDRLENGANAAVGLGEAAQALDSRYAISGKAKDAVIKQAKVALSQQYQHAAVFMKRNWRIKLQLAQCFLTVPQQIEQVGTDSAYKQRSWTGADFVGVKDVAVKAGTGTMMSPAEKQQYVAVAMQQGWLDEEESAVVGRSTLADDLGVSSSPHEESISRELAKWSEGPPEGWEQQAAAYDQEQQAIQAAQAQAQMQAQQMQAQAAAMGGMMDPAMMPMMPQPPQPTVPAPWSPFTPRPIDEDPVVARKHYLKMRDFCATGDYTKQPPRWRQVFDERYTRASYAAGVVTQRQKAEMGMQQQQAAQSQPKQEPSEPSEPQPQAA